ncbi:MAG: hypothetical protein OXB91_07370 [Bryobacterales bacterium]|nr:hypothetical protein [Bryobacterales bacterium]
MHLAYVIEVGIGSGFLVTTHESDITLGDKTYAGGLAINVDDVQISEDSPDNRTTLTFSLIEGANYLEFGIDPGPVEVLIGFARSEDGAEWTRMDRELRGKLSTPNIEGREVTVEMESIRGDVDSDGIRYWSHEDQQRAYRGDRGFEYTRAIASGREVGGPL